MRLTDLRPKKVEFSVLGLDLVYRPFTIEDDLNAVELCGGQDKMKSAFENFDFEKISLIAWYQLDLESQKKVLSSVAGYYIDPETGDEIDQKLKPIQKFRKLFEGLEGQISMITNLVKCKGLNIPDFDDEEASKNWADQLTESLSTGP